ncbi:hypothetical protein [Parahalioglobus pacificus]|uniref:Uncharacterized protein n=1 Tax=Parahalioglobus pacificus TaxID=930806 RepID=A0A919CLE9_9GAMM|nr:hypothetical protein [Halioglobus pacificus]GHD34596.1 hypothetical protein GCM10007053_20570 [Halioglobus pacificus]
MTAVNIREMVNRALAQEQRSGELRSRLERAMPQLHQRLDIHGEEPAETLLAFVSSYIASVPGCLMLVTAASKRLGFYDYAAPFLAVAEDFFLAPPSELDEDGGLMALLDEAFLAHRLLEEINDRHLQHLGRPLLPLDMTEANTIAHHLIGDTKATRLEHLIQFTADRLLHKEHLWEPLKDLPGSQAGGGAHFDGESLGAPGRAVRLRLAEARPV